MAKVYGGGKAPGDRFFDPVERAIYRLCGVDPDTRAALDDLRALAARLQPGVGPVRATCSSGSRAHLPLNPDHLKGVSPELVVQHRGQLRHQHELAELRRRVDDEPPHPDGRARGAELRVGRGRAGGRGGADPRPGPAPASARSATSGSTSSARTLRILLPLAFVFAIVLVEPGRHPELPRLHAPSTTVAGARPRRSPAARSPARRRSRSSAPTAAGSSTPTRRTRSRTRTGSPNMLEICLLAR